jgi:hypothetical protein
MCSHQVPNVRTPQALNAFLACSQALNVFPKMFTITHYTLSHNFCQSWTINIIMPSMKHLYHYILEVQTFIWGGVQTSKFQITFEIVWYASHNYLIELTIGDSQVMVVFHGQGLNHVYYKITMYLKTLCIIGPWIICQKNNMSNTLGIWQLFKLFWFKSSQLLSCIFQTKILFHALQVHDYYFCLRKVPT